MRWTAMGPYAVISDCGNYTISQAKARGGWVFSAYYKKAGPIAQAECVDEAGERAVAAADVKKACAAHARGQR